MKKILSVILALVMISACVAAFSSCGSEKSDFEKVKDKGYFIVGYTFFEPMNFAENDDLTGFDTELAKMVAAELGVEVKFQLITWNTKYLELSSGAIDCIWNGFTSNCADDDGIQRKDKVDFSLAYMDNAQCVIVRSEDVDKYTSAESLKGKTCAVEAGSAGASYAASVTDEDKIVGKSSQMDTLIELNSDKVDFIVIDVLLANSVVGKGDNADLAKVDAIEIEKEEYSIGFRKGSDFTEKVNDAIKKFAQDGSLQALVDKYGKYNLNLTAELAALQK